MAMADSTQPQAAGLDPEFLAMLVCPQSRKPLVLKGNRLLCKESGLAYRIEDGIPILLIEEAERISDAERAELG
jgi:uncharacterized protein YbaR (Trm112 family)